MAAVIPGNSRSRPTFLFSSVLTRNLDVVFALQTVSQLTDSKKRKEKKGEWRIIIIKKLEGT